MSDSAAVPAKKPAGALLEKTRGVFRRHNPVLWAAEALGLFFLLKDLFVLARIFLINRSLWVDEAMLSYALFHRSSFFVTSADMLTWNQSAPVLYIYFTKILAALFGRSEWVLRVPALLA